MDLITYEALYEILRKDKFNNELQQLNPEFYQQTIRYLKEKEAVVEAQQKKTDIFSTSELQKTKKQLENIKKILRELYEIRERKITDLAIFSSRSNEDLSSENMTPQEKLLFNETKEVFDNYRKGILLNLIQGNLPELGIKEEKTEELKTPNKEIKKLIKFIKTTPKFIAEDMYTYGPFETEDVANIPIKAAELLEKNKKAETYENT